VRLQEPGKGASTVERDCGGKSRPTVLPYIGSCDTTDGASELMETDGQWRDWISTAALGVSIVALLISGVSAYYTYRSDRRAEEATLPIVEWKIARVELREIDVRVTIRNSSVGAVEFTRIQIDEPAATILPSGPLTQATIDARNQVLAMTGAASAFPANEHISTGETKSFDYRVSLPITDAAHPQMNFRMKITIERGSESRSPLFFAVSRTL
jgi:hypothetical protein